MVFASLPAYFDPHNWNQQQQAQQAGGGSGVGRGTSGGGDGGAHLQLPIPPRPEGGRGDGGGGGGGGGCSGFTAATIRSGSMAERARLAKIPQPEAAVKCPRCDSTNTKFCYFNNYSLSQPRHFCKTCRRYWTRGGALRNVPVGGSCRRNKRSRSGSTKSSASIVHLTGTSSAGGVLPPAGVGATSSHISAQSSPLRLPFLTSLHPLPDYGSNYGGLQTIDVDGTGGVVDYHQVGGSSGSMGLQQWRLQPHLQQLPFFAGLEQHTTPTTPELGLYQFDGDGRSVTSFVGQAHGKSITPKMEETQQPHDRLNFSRRDLGIPGSNDQYWSCSVGGGGSTGAVSTITTTAAGAGGWTAAAATTDLPGYNPTTTTTTTTVNLL